MRVTVLGGYAGVASTGDGCSGYLIRQGTTSVVADLGPGTLSELRRQVRLDEIGGIVVSHGHLDHVLDLASLHLLMLYSPMTPKPRIPLYLPPDPTGRLQGWLESIAAANDGAGLGQTFDVREYDPNSRLMIGDVHVEFAPTVHSLQAFGMRFQGVSGAIGYTADTGPSAPLDGLFTGVDVLVSEATLIGSDIDDDSPEPRGHLTATEAGLLATRARATTLVLSHRWEEHDAASQRAEAASVFSGWIEVASAGLAVLTSLVG